MVGLSIRRNIQPVSCLVYILRPKELWLLSQPFLSTNRHIRTNCAPIYFWLLFFRCPYPKLSKLTISCRFKFKRPLKYVNTHSLKGQNKNPSIEKGFRSKKYVLTHLPLPDWRVKIIITTWPVCFFLAFSLRPIYLNSYNRRSIFF